MIEFELGLWLNFEYPLLLYLLKFYIRVARLTQAEKRASATMITANPTKKLYNLFSIHYKFMIFQFHHVLLFISSIPSFKGKKQSRRSQCFALA